MKSGWLGFPLVHVGGDIYLVVSEDDVGLVCSVCLHDGGIYEGI